MYSAAKRFVVWADAAIDRIGFTVAFPAVTLGTLVFVVAVGVVVAGRL